jgi:glycosyltransferase involved in cell wall biosynthesis
MLNAMDQTIAQATQTAAVDVSIIVSTKDRCADLKDMLAHLGQVRVPDGWEVELIVVDNGSSDDTKLVVSQAKLPNMKVRYALEPRRGKSHALNTGVSMSSGKALLMTDDDVHVPVNWIEDMCRPIISGAADAVQGGIRLAPHLERPWLTGALRVWVAAVEDPTHRPEGLVGANMAISRRAIDLVGLYDPRLGPGASGNYEDTKLGWALTQAGLKILYQPTVAVEHNFDADRLTVEAFMSAARRMAVSRAIVERERDPANSRPSLLALLAQAPGLAWRSLTQLMRLATNRQPDAGFMARYYRLKLWQELRRAA